MLVTWQEVNYSFGDERSRGYISWDDPHFAHSAALEEVLRRETAYGRPQWYIESLEETTSLGEFVRRVGSDDGGLWRREDRYISDGRE